jgi:hypothetical protein
MVFATLAAATAVRVGFGFTVWALIGVALLTLAGMSVTAVRRSQGPLPKAEQLVVLAVIALAVTGLWPNSWQTWLMLAGLTGAVRRLGDVPVLGSGHPVHRGAVGQPARLAHTKSCGADHGRPCRRSQRGTAEPGPTQGCR